MIKGYLFLLKLQKSLLPNQNIGGNYTFIKWMPNGGLQFRINKNQCKSIPAELLILAYHIHIRNNKIKHPISINYQWLYSNGYLDWCFVEVINHLLNNLSIISKTNN